MISSAPKPCCLGWLASDSPTKRLISEDLGASQGIADMPRKPRPKPDDPDESKRFEQAARDAESDESGAIFEREVDVLIPPLKQRTDTCQSTPIAVPRKRPN